MKVLLTGSRGFVASAIARKLVADGHRVVGIGRTPAVGVPYEFAVCDISDASAVDEVLAAGGFDAVVHAAACLSDNPAELFATNILGTANLVKGCERHGVGVFVHLSSIPVVEGSDSAVDETARVKPPTAYHLSKAAAELLVENARGVRTVIFRFASPVGVGMPGGKIFSSFVRKALDNEDIDIWGDGERVQNYIAVDDIAKAAVSGISLPGLQGLYHLAGESISDRGLAELCVEALGAKSRINVLNKMAGGDKWYVDDSKFRAGCNPGAPRSLRDVVVELAGEMRGDGRR